jgi:transcription antitermination factor NusG
MEHQMNSQNLIADASTLASESFELREWPSLPREHYEPRWYAIHTSSNHEKRVSQQLGIRKVEYFLPLYESVRRWRNGRVTLQRPLFPGYVFVRIALREKLRVQQVPGVARLVGFNGHPSMLADDEIHALQNLIGSGIRAEPFPYLTKGRRIRVCAGPLAGREGIVVRRKGSCRVVLSIDVVQRAILVDIDTEAIEIL